MKNLKPTRLAQIRASLGPTLQELGLTPKLCVSEERFLYIIFMNKSRDAFSNLQILVCDPAVRGWEACTLITLNYETFDVGDNGWICYGKDHQVERDLSADPVEALGLIEAGLRTAGMHYFANHPNYARNPALRVLCNELKEECEEEITPIICSRDGDTERLSFSDVFGHDWMVAVEEYDTTLYLDGNKVGAIGTDRYSDIVKVVTDHLCGRRYPQWPSR